MSKKVKWALLAILGFATACSSVKNSSKGAEQNNDKDSTQVEHNLRRIIVMYGVRPPVSLEEAERAATAEKEKQTQETPQTSETTTTPESEN